MKILYITPNFQHPLVRGSERCYHFIRAMHQRHEITLMTPTLAEIPTQALDEMKRYLNDIYIFNAIENGGKKSVGFGGKYLKKLSKKLRKSRKMNRVVQQMRKKLDDLIRVESFDVLLFHGKSVFSVIEDWAELPIVIDFCDATTLRYRDRMKIESAGKRVLLSQRYQHFREIEEKMARKSAHLAFISGRDRDAVLKNPGEQVRIVPNGVDLDFWTRKTRSPQKNCLVFTGVMDYSPNEDAALYFIDEILPLLRPKIPDLETLIVGRDPTPELVERGNLNPDVTVTGFVEDVRPWLERGSLFIAPVRFASGTQNKVLEAFAMETPVLCSSTVADGLRLGDGNLPLHIADTPQRFADEIIQLLEKPVELQRLATEGRRFVEKYFVWEQNVQILEKMCRAAIAAFAKKEPENVVE